MSIISHIAFDNLKLTHSVDKTASKRWLYIVTGLRKSRLW